MHSIVIPVFNEVEGLDILFKRMQVVADQIKAQEGETVEVIFVNDGSKDGSENKLNGYPTSDSRFKIIHLSRNFGHQIAISAGLEWAQGQTVTVMDADLQDPPEVILEFLKKWHEGFDVVYGVRKHREGETIFKLWTAKVFYRLIRKLTNFEIPVDTGDFRLMNRSAVDAFLKLPEKNRFIRGLVAWIGFKQAGVLYNRNSRLHGQTHYPLRKMLRFALDGITSFSAKPLQLATYLGFFSAIVSFFGIAWLFYLRFLTDRTVQGWTSIMFVVLFLGGVQLMALGVIGEYLGRVFEEVRQRPLYFISKTIGFNSDKK